MKRETIERVMRIPKDMGRHHVGAYAAQAAYFFMLSLIPIILLLLTMVRYTPVTKADVMWHCGLPARVYYQFLPDLIQFMDAQRHVTIFICVLERHFIQCCS